jgi:hypothetical protein
MELTIMGRTTARIKRVQVMKATHENGGWQTYRVSGGNSKYLVIG